MAAAYRRYLLRSPRLDLRSARKYTTGTRIIKNTTAPMAYQLAKRPTLRPGMAS